MRVVAVAVVLVGALVLPAPASGGDSRRETASALYLAFAEAKRATQRGVVAYGRRNDEDVGSPEIRRCARLSRVLVGCRFNYFFDTSDSGTWYCTGWLMRVTKLAEHRYRARVARKHECEQQSDG